MEKPLVKKSSEVLEKQRRPLITILTIVAEYLGTHGYDGLFNDDGYDTCSCELVDLFPCGSINGACQPGYKVPCNCGDHDWHIDIRRPGAKDLLEEILPLKNHVLKEILPLKNQFLKCKDTLGGK